MASQVRASSFNLKLDLLRKGHEFSFFQVMRLLRFFGEDIEKTEEKGSDGKGNIRIRPDLSLGFPAADIAAVKESEDEGPRFLVTATFLGLYGTSSPLPSFYTEDLIDEASDDMSATRDFIDIFNHRLFVLLYNCWTKYRQFLQVVEHHNAGDLERLFCFLGLGEEGLRQDVPESYSLLRYAGLFTQYPRSAVGLKTLLRDALNGIPIEIMPCIQRSVQIPPDQRLLLGVTGSSLGQSTYIGEEIDDRMGKFRLRIGPLKGDQFHSLLPGNPDHNKLAFLTKFYVLDPLEYDLMLILEKGEAGPVCLGASQWSRLGWDTWTFSEGPSERVDAIFPLKYN